MLIQPLMRASLYGVANFVTSFTVLRASLRDLLDCLQIFSILASRVLALSVASAWFFAACLKRLAFISS